MLEAYALTATLPKQETYGLALQMRRAAVSIPADIAEGFRRRGKADKARYFLILVKDLGYGDTQNLSAALEEVSRLLGAYAAAILSRNSPPWPLPGRRHGGAARIGQCHVLFFRAAPAWSISDWH